MEATKIGRYIDNTSSGNIGAPDPGDTIEYTLTIETGNVSVFNMDITDQMNYSEMLLQLLRQFLLLSQISIELHRTIDSNDSSKYTLLVGEI